ncbi:Crp/Fnr family transcriptional regulator [Helcococcus kunzii]|uniref:Crp/Fnr family transcriptional regulator n=1 Tax=Helcococcus kunzii TaxID=40091 RepID=UPI001BAE8F01|nr:Crp/Fnr family transcriptional regulator [Helcococcus kunzii]MCT1796732.1 Crp/Fnr family transcriptional regulator [Helcococcus kunzii]MCT1988880.1 Crp/Fnr family transcriptional regulator [Helcococcus kunzii]QUY64525.1 Crp/Fnr family transcriptional regulator [Helcococcus kunzii]
MDRHSCAYSVPIFSHLSNQSISKIDGILTRLEFERGETIFSPLKPIGMFIVARGKVKEYQISASGKEQLLRIIGSGGVVGEHTLFSDEAPETYVDAITKTSICLLRKEDFKNILLENPTISFELLTEYNKKLKETEKQTLTIATENVNSRIASFILDIALSKNENIIELPFALKELASFLATTPETVSRKLKDLELGGYIIRSGSKIKIIDLEEFSEYTSKLKND